MRKRFGAVAAILALVSAAPATASDLATGVLEELNLARTSPQTYAERLREYRTWFTGRVVTIPGTGDQALTREGGAIISSRTPHANRGEIAHETDGLEVAPCLHAGADDGQLRGVASGQELHG